MTLTVLVVDDDAIVRRIIRLGLEHEGFTIAEAVDGLDALKKAAQCHPDLVVMDVMMPHMDGLTACRYLKQNETTVDIPIIILSADTSAQNIKSGYEAGAVMYIKKPVSINVLSQTIYKLLHLHFSAIS